MGIRLQGLGKLFLFSLLLFSFYLFVYCTERAVLLMCEGASSSHVIELASKSNGNLWFNHDFFVFFHYCLCMTVGAHKLFGENSGGGFTISHYFCTLRKKALNTKLHTLVFSFTWPTMKAKSIALISSRRFFRSTTNRLKIKKTFTWYYLMSQLLVLPWHNVQFSHKF